MNRVERLQMLTTYRQWGLNLISPKPRTKALLVKWKDRRPTDEQLLKYLGLGANRAIRCYGNLYALDFDSAEAYQTFIHGDDKTFRHAPRVCTSRGCHVWFNRKRPARRFIRNGIEVRGLWSLAVASPAVNTSSTDYRFVSSALRWTMNDNGVLGSILGSECFIANVLFLICHPVGNRSPPYRTLSCLYKCQ